MAIASPESIYSVTDFHGEMPPARIMGTEMEYLLPVGVTDISALRAMVTRGQRQYGRMGQQMLLNSGRLYMDVGMAEYAAPESLGPQEAVFTEMAGEKIVRDAARLTFDGQQTLYRRTGGYGNDGFESVGYHQNLLTTPYESRHEQLRDARILGAYAITRIIWSGNGMLGRNYRLSQKALGVSQGDEEDLFCIGTHGRRTMHEAKPVLSWSRAGTGIEPHASGWQRLELRHADAAHSPWARFMGLATASLVLRVLEHKELFPDQNWGELALKYPARNVREVSNDLLMKRELATQAGTTTTSLGLQTRLAEMADKLTEKVLLPEDEKTAVHEWIRICEDLSSSSDVYETAAKVQDRVEWAARLLVLRKQGERRGAPGLFFRNKLLAGTDIAWDQIYPRAPAEKHWRTVQADFFAKHEAEIDDFIHTAPRFTRAHFRSRLMHRNYRVEDAVWDRVKAPNDRPKHLPDPYDYGD